MTDLRKAAEMALEALEWNYGTDLENIENCTKWLDYLNKTIPALRQAIEQAEESLVKSYCGGKPNYCTPEVSPEVAGEDTGEVGACVTCGAPKGEWLVDAVNISQERVDEMAKGEHEPVAWFVQYEYRHEFLWRKPNELEQKTALEIRPLYTAPPISDYHEGWEEGFKAAKREWVGLTHEERFLNDCRSPEEIEYAKAIEAKLKEKNT
jgi:hypothetical protein